MNENEIPENLKKAMEDYAHQFELMDADKKLKDLNEIRDELLRQVNDVDLQIEKLARKFMLKAKELEEYIEAQILELGSSVNHAGVQAKHTSGFTRTTWQGKVIDKILFDNPSFIPIFKTAKKETPVAPRVNVTYLGPPEEKESVAYTREDYESDRAEVETEDELPF